MIIYNKVLVKIDKKLLMLLHASLLLHKNKLGDMSLMMSNVRSNQYLRKIIHYSETCL